MLGIWAAVLWSGALPGAGREIPVYREYVQPILFYFEGEDGGEFVIPAYAPDMLAIQLLREAKSQEPYVGRENLRDIVFIYADKVLGLKEPNTGKIAPQADDGLRPNRRRQAKDSDRNWLVRSLTLPTLGQLGSNTAAVAMGAEKDESALFIKDRRIAASADATWESSATEDGGSYDWQMHSGGPNPGTSPDDIRNLSSQSSGGSKTEMGGERLTSRSQLLEEARGSERTVRPSEEKAIKPKGESAERLSQGLSQTKQLLADLPAIPRQVSEIRTELLNTKAVSPPGQLSDSASIASRPLKEETDKKIVFGSAAIDYGRNTFVGPSPSARLEGARVSSWRGEWKPQNWKDSIISYPAARYDIIQQRDSSPASRVTKPTFSSGAMKPGWY